MKPQQYAFHLFGSNHSKVPVVVPWSSRDQTYPCVGPLTEDEKNLIVSGGPFEFVHARQKWVAVDGDVLPNYNGNGGGK